MEKDLPLKADGDGALLRDGTALVRDLFQPNPRIYWRDYLFHLVLGWGAFYGITQFPLSSPLKWICYLISSLALYRAAIFIHELAHLKRGSFSAFRAVWNLTVGLPMFLPSFAYVGVHLHHHKRNSYGTTGDGEYLPLALENPLHLITFVVLNCTLPIVFAFRALVVTPLTLISPWMREWAWRRFSSLAIDLSYERPPAHPEDAPWFRLQEILAFVYGVVFVSLIVSGILPISVVVTWYFVAVGAFFMNSLRTLAGHRYRNPGDHSLTLEEQFLDSVDIKGHRFFTALWAPVGLRYHATHHLFPSMPYHNLGEARRRLEAGLPDASVYLRALEPSLYAALKTLWSSPRPRRLSTTGTPALEVPTS